MTMLTPSQLDQLVIQLKQDYQALMIEAPGTALENVGEQHRIDLLKTGPATVVMNPWPSTLADLNEAGVASPCSALRDIEAALRRIRDDAATAATPSDLPACTFTLPPSAASCASQKI